RNSHSISSKGSTPSFVKYRSNSRPVTDAPGPEVRPICVGCVVVSAVIAWARCITSSRCPEYRTQRRAAPSRHLTRPASRDAATTSHCLLSNRRQRPWGGKGGKNTCETLEGPRGRLLRYRRTN